MTEDSLARDRQAAVVADGNVVGPSLSSKFRGISREVGPAAMDWLLRWEDLDPG